LRPGSTGNTSIYAEQLNMAAHARGTRKDAQNLDILHCFFLCQPPRYQKHLTFFAVTFLRTKLRQLPQICYLRSHLFTKPAWTKCGRIAPIASTRALISQSACVLTTPQSRGGRSSPGQHETVAAAFEAGIGSFIDQFPRASSIIAIQRAVRLSPDRTAVPWQLLPQK
jgi:hypothetical protein